MSDTRVMNADWDSEYYLAISETNRVRRFEKQTEKPTFWERMKQVINWSFSRQYGIFILYLNVEIDNSKPQKKLK